MPKGISRPAMVSLTVEGIAIVCCLLFSAVLAAQQHNPDLSMTPASSSAGQPAFLSPPDPTAARPLLINLPSALQLANAQALDIAAASARLRIAVALLEKANV